MPERIEPCLVTFSLYHAALSSANCKKTEGISDVRDESDRDGMRIVIELKRGEESQLILNMPCLGQIDNQLEDRLI